MTTATSLPQKFPDNLVTQPGCTYVIDRVISLSADLSIAAGVTLIFQGGRFENANYANSQNEPAPVTIKAPATGTSDNEPADGVTIEAPLSVIFGKGVKATGFWVCPYASPVWFEAKEKDHHVQPTSRKILDYADSINKAIEMKQSGIVFLPKGDYLVSKPVKIPVGITLQGEKSRTYSVMCTKIYPLGTVPKPASELPSDPNQFCFNKTYPYDYVFLVNCDYNSSSTTNQNPQPIINLPTPWTALDNMMIINMPEVNKGCRCAYACGGAMFQKIEFFDFIQAVVYSAHYADGKAITDCNSGYSYDFSKLFPIDTVDNSRKYYLFDMGGLGDSILFMHNHVAAHPLKKALHIQMCGGGTYQGNILNGDVHIIGSKAITFSDNHMEGGAQILIEDSVVSTHSNFIYKGTRPSIVIKRVEYKNADGTTTHNPYTPVVSMENDQLIFCTRATGTAEENEQSANKGTNKNNWPIRRKRLESISEYDIDIDSYATLSLTNVFRYDIVNAFDELFPFGILVTSPNGPIKEFNDHSYFCSQESTIMPNYLVRSDFKADKLNEPTCGFPNGVAWPHGAVPWLAPEGTYKYSFVIEWDPVRNIVGLDNNNKAIRYIEKAIITGFGQYGLILLPVAFGSCSSYYQARFYREYTGPNGEKKLETVAVPICGSRIMYDNGFSIAGFRWETLEGTTIESIVTPRYEVYRYASGHVEAFANSQPMPTTAWSKGDIIYNVGPATDWDLKIVK